MSMKVKVKESFLQGNIHVFSITTSVNKMGICISMYLGYHCLLQNPNSSIILEFHPGKVFWLYNVVCTSWQGPPTLNGTQSTVLESHMFYSRKILQYLKVSFQPLKMEKRFIRNILHWHSDLANNQLFIMHNLFETFIHDMLNLLADFCHIL